MRRITIAGLLAAVWGCGSSTLTAPDAATDARGDSVEVAAAGADASPDAACSDPRFPGMHICCGQPGEMAGANCVPPSAIPAGCAGEGEAADLKRFIVCCEGLAGISIARPAVDPASDAGLCDEPFVVDPSRICARCGDGNCGMGENPCNCPQDCGQPH